MTSIPKRSVATVPAFERGGQKSLLEDRRQRFEVAEVDLDDFPFSGIIPELKFNIRAAVVDVHGIEQLKRRVGHQHFHPQRYI